VPSHIFPDGQQGASVVEERGRMQAAGPLEQRLSRTKGSRQGGQQFRIEPQIAFRRPDSTDAHRLNRCLSADAAARRGKEMPPETFVIDSLSGAQLHVDGVAVADAFSAAGVGDA
jgi:hypothetical protein